MKRVVTIIHVLLLFALLGASGCAQNGQMRQQHKFWSDQSVQSGAYANKPQVGTYDKDYIKSIGERRFQSSHIV